MIASSYIESVNAYIKQMLFNSNVSLCKLMIQIHKLLDEQDKKNQYKYWKLAIPSIKNIERVNFLFTEVNKCYQRFLMPAILKLQYDKINQSLYYATISVNQQEIVTTSEESYNKSAKSLQYT